ncbi:MAG: NAD-dependent epimerase/dehydratase family protein [Bacteroidota bacterium]
MKIFITGGSGFVGRNIIPLLVENGHIVHALARSEDSAKLIEGLGAIPVRDNLKQLSENTEFALQQCDVVIHSAAHMDFTYDPKPFYEINVLATETLLQLSKICGIQKFIYISAAPVVAGSPIVNLKENQATHKLPRDLYPKTKAIAEKAVLRANSDTFLTLSLRPPAIWGPNNHHYDEILSRVKKGKWRWIGGGHQVLSTIHVNNLGNAILAAISSDKGGKAYFVTDGDRRSMRETFESVIKEFNLDPGKKELPRWIAVVLAHFFGGLWKLLKLKSRPPIAPLMIRLMATEFSVSDEKARQELGYKNAISFKEGLKTINP